jgi:hypothetical protein
MVLRFVDAGAVAAEIARVRLLSGGALRRRWQAVFGRPPPEHLTADLLRRMIAARIQEGAFGTLDRTTLKLLDGLARREVALARARRHGEELTGAGDVVAAGAAGEQAVMADAMEAVWQHMDEEAADELAGRSPGTAQARRRRATSIPLFVDPWGAVAMNSAVAARVTALFLPIDGDRASICAGFERSPATSLESTAS